MSRVSGVYAITNAARGKAYVGSSVDLARRKRDHLRELRAGTHANRKLQSAWNKYGEENFEFSTLEAVERHEDLLVREQFWIDEMKAIANGYNLSPTAGNCLGVRHSEEVRKRMSVSQSKEQRRLQGKKGRENMTPEAIAEARRRMCAALTPEIRKAASAKARATLGAVGRSERARKVAASRKASGQWEKPETTAKRSASLKRVAGMRTEEERKAIAAKSAAKFSTEARARAGR